MITCEFLVTLGAFVRSLVVSVCTHVNRQILRQRKRLSAHLTRILRSYAASIHLISFFLCWFCLFWQFIIHTRVSSHYIFQDLLILAILSLTLIGRFFFSHMNIGLLTAIFCLFAALPLSSYMHSSPHLRMLPGPNKLAKFRRVGP